MAHTQPSATFEHFNDNSRPRRFLIALFLIGTALFALIGGVIAWQMWRNAPVPQTAVLTRVSGLVELKMSAAASWKPATPGTTLEVGYQIRTSEDAAATITFFDGSITQLSRNTTIIITDLTATRSGRSHHIAFSQQVGQTEQLVLPAHNGDAWLEISTAAGTIKTQAATYQIIVADNGNTRITVTQGELLVHDGQDDRTLAAGDGLTLAARSTTPIPVSNPTVAAPLDETATPTATPTPTATATATNTPTPTAQGTSPATLTLTATPSPTATSTATAAAASPTPRPTLTALPTSIPATLQPTATATPFPPPPTPVPSGDNDNGNDNDDDDDDNDNDDDDDDDNDNDDDDDNDND